MQWLKFFLVNIEVSQLLFLLTLKLDLSNSVEPRVLQA